VNNQVEIYWIIGLLLVDLLVAAARSGLLNIRHARLISLRETQEIKVEKTIELVTRRAKLRSTLKLTQAVLRFAMAGIALSLFAPAGSFDLPTSLISVVLLATALAIWLMEFAIERRILKDPEIWAVRLTPLANFLVILLSPILAIPLRLSRSNVLSRNLVTITEDELMSLVDASQKAGEIEKDESEMIHSVFRFDETLVREIMVPRVDILMLDANTPLEKAADVVLESGFSRVPVFQNQIDNVIGMLYTKDMLKVWRKGDGINSLKELLRPAYFIPESKKVDELLDEMQAKRIHISVVVDEYGGIAGIVTLEDIVEEIFGEIEDEFDEEEQEPYQEINEDEYLFEGRIPLDDVNDLMGTNLDAEDADTLGGLIFTRTGDVPKKGKKIREKGLVLIVEQIDGRRIRKVRVKRLDKDAAADSPS
jgi:CBS domain containing-hemolysin-like protein